MNGVHAGRLAKGGSTKKPKSQSPTEDFRHPSSYFRQCVYMWTSCPILDKLPYIGQTALYLTKRPISKTPLMSSREVDKLAHFPTFFHNVTKSSLSTHELKDSG